MRVVGAQIGCLTYKASKVTEAVGGQPWLGHCPKFCSFFTFKASPGMYFLFIFVHNMFNNTLLVFCFI